MKKKYIRPEIEIVGLKDEICLWVVSVGRTKTTSTGKTTFETDETFPIHETGNPWGDDDDEWDKFDNWGGD